MPISAGMALFASLIIRTFQLVFSAETVFFSHNKSAGVSACFFSKANRANSTKSKPS